MSRVVGTLGGRERLLDAASQHFSQGGYDGIGVSVLLETAKVQAPTLYHHFGDKEGLFTQWCLMELRALSAKVAEANDPQAPFASGLGSLASAIMQHTHFDLKLMLRDAERLTKPDNREQVMEAYLQALYNPVYTMLLRGTQKGVLKNEPLGPMTEVFLSSAFALARFPWKSDQPWKEVGAWWAKSFVRAFANPTHALIHTP